MKNSSRRKSLIASAAVLACLLASVCVRTTATSAAQSEQAERVLEDKIPVHLPIKVKVKNLQNKHWARDLEVEVRNTGSKPIYVLDIFILMPEVKGPNGSPMGFGFYYGPGRPVTVGMRPEPEDVPLNPGESHTFKIGEREVMPWEDDLIKPDAPRPKKFKVMFSMLSFGDGTGFQGTDGTRIPVRRSSSAQCAPQKQLGAYAVDPPPARPAPRDRPTRSAARAPVASTRS